MCGHSARCPAKNSTLRRGTWWAVCTGAWYVMRNYRLAYCNKLTKPRKNAKNTHEVIFMENMIRIRGAREHNLKNIDVTIPLGTFTVITGESGSGKSLIAKVISNSIKDNWIVTADRFRFNDVELLKLTPNQRRKIVGKEISMIFQEPMTSLNPLMKVGKQIEEAIKAHEKVSNAELKERAIAAIRDVGIPQPEKVYHDIPSRLSGGMRQRIMIAMALVCHPKLLICDEPTTALDVTIQAQILRLIKKLRDETNTAVIFISHDMGVIYQMVDRVVVMYAGQFVESAPCKKLFEKPLHPYTIGLQNAMGRRLPSIRKTIGREKACNSVWRLECCTRGNRLKEP